MKWSPIKIRAQEATKPKSVHRSPSKFNAKARCTAESKLTWRRDYPRCACLAIALRSTLLLAIRFPFRAATYPLCWVPMEGSTDSVAGGPRPRNLVRCYYEVACGSHPFDSGPSRSNSAVEIFFMLLSRLSLSLSKQFPERLRQNSGDCCRNTSPPYPPFHLQSRRQSDAH
jgi:hypothetical protein